MVSWFFVCQNIALQLLEIALIDSTDKICEVSQPFTDDDTINFLLAVADSADKELDKHVGCSRQGMLCQNICALEFDNHENYFTCNIIYVVVIRLPTEAMFFAC